ncbi:uncharacterized protein EI97DRAFT_457802 [Westerdykella ornata]|uniref:PH domain-containing protein n=1 Tax=Westerdykella ornata TaxID=318751 RepID=A0A6A6JLT9_WESOR|nr:uncharacterized protein EI97DRAFT_457802 [Westerdykella ornata]KAF2277073.1 hypothetical protein EI97DRAFT_457802 [Westerdykella ornata]
MDDRDSLDPFTTSVHDAQRHRHSAFDKSHFSLYLNGSPEQAKRALQAHLSETARRLQETSVLGNSLVQQKKELEERLREVEAQQSNSEIGPELRQRLADLEKEFNEVGRETARAFLPRSRVPSGETDATGGASVYSSEALASPSKVSVPTRKQRNQQPSRVNELTLATEISASLLSQVKELQALLLEKEELLKATNLERSQLELEVEGLSQRLRTLDERESQLKDVNWNLETQVRELEAAAKESADKEARTNHNLSVARAENSTLERELDELKQLYAKLNDDHIAKVKHHEAEIAGLRRNASAAETERNALQRKIDDLASQNQELARAVAYRMRPEEQVPIEETPPDADADEGTTMTPEHSPLPSPSKATPRHGQLESETLKHSLQHAHRMIQQLKNNIHREKTEKLELKRMLQDARDELETTRNSMNGLGSASKRRKQDKDVFKKPPRPDRLGSFRPATQEIVTDEDEWEDQEVVHSTPSRRSRHADRVPGAFPGGFSSAADTSTEASDAFETANERDGTATETEAFQTGAETLDGDSTDELTETEAGRSTGTIRGQRPSPRGMVSNRDSYESTASTSGEEDNDVDLKTPIQSQHPRYKLKMRQAGYRRSTPRSQDIFANASSAVNTSPASFTSTSNHGTPAQGKSLFAELGDFGGESEDGSVAEGTPSRSSFHSPESSPETLRKSVLAVSPLQPSSLPKVLMVDSEMMTEPWEPEVTTVDLSLSSLSSQTTEPQAPPLPALGLSSFETQATEPIPASSSPLGLSTVSTQATTPLPASPPLLGPSSLVVQATEPIVVPSPLLHLSSHFAQETEPQAPRRAPLLMSAHISQDTVPRLAPPPSFNLSGLTAQTTDPISSVTTDQIVPALDLSPISHQATEPLEPTLAEVLPLPVPLPGSEKEVEKQPAPVPLQMSTVSSQSTPPIEPSLPKEPAPVPLQNSAISSQSTQPVVPSLPKPQLSVVSTQATEPIEPRKPVFSQTPILSAQATEPVEPRAQPLGISVLSSQGTLPVEAKPRPLGISVFSSQDTPPVETKSCPLGISVISSHDTSPVEPPTPPPLQLSAHSFQATEPVDIHRQALPQFSEITAQQTVPVAAPAAKYENGLSPVDVLHDVQPESPTLPSFLPSPSRPSTAKRVPRLDLSLSSVNSQETEPLTPSRPATAHRAVSVPTDSSSESTTDKPASAKLGFFSSAVLSWSTNDPSAAGEHETSHSPAPISTVESQPQVPSPAPANPRAPTVDEGTQTMVSADQIDKLLAARSAQRYPNNVATNNTERAMSPPTSPRRMSDSKVPRRHGSSSSIRSRTEPPPPLPADHREVIAAAALKKAPSVVSAPPGDMGPPIMPASAYKKRPQTPTVKTSGLINTKTGGTTPRPRNQAPRSDVGRSGASSPMTRRSSVSSFGSEIDRRFQGISDPFSQSGFDASNTDPRMIQAVTQTMIGEFLWKYTRRTGRGELSENRHRRFFWVHPYTRTLYWSDHDPATGSRNEMKAKSVPIEAVRVVPDDNPYPPGLHHKSLIIVTPGRCIKFTATTGQRHDTWYNALSYLLQRTESGTVESQEEQKESVDEIQDEFNPTYRSLSRLTNRSRTSSYFSRQTASPHPGEVPTLRQSTTPHRRPASTEPPQESGRLSSLSGYFRPGSTLRNSFTSRRSRTGAQEAVAYETPENDPNYELTQELATKSVRDREHIPGMENVRACCDGKHDVGHLHTPTPKHRHSSFRGTRASVAGSVSSRSQSRTESRGPNE